MLKLSVDDLVQFIYNGGSNPGSLRRVKVKETYNDFFCGIDIDLSPSDNIRNFTHTYILDLKILSSLLTTYHTGQRFQYRDGNEYILSLIDNSTIILISLNDGNRWLNGKEAKDFQHITEQELKSIMNTPNGNEFENFKLL